MLHQRAQLTGEKSVYWGCARKLLIGEHHPKDQAGLSRRAAAGSASSSSAAPLPEALPMGFGMLLLPTQEISARA